MRRALGRGLLLVGSLAGLAAFLECAGWIFGVEPRADDARYQSVHVMAQCRAHDAHVEQFCDPEAVAGKPGQFVVFTFGGSSVQHDPSGRTPPFPTLLRRRLAMRSPGQYAVRNFGLACKDSIYVRRCAERVLAARPDLVVIYAGHNDFANFVLKHPRIQIFVEWNPWITELDGALSGTRAYSLPFWLAERLRAVSYRDFRRLPGEGFEAGKRIALEEYTRNIRSVLEETASSQTPVRLVTVASNLHEFPLAFDEWDEIEGYGRGAEGETQDPLAEWRAHYREGIAVHRAGRGPEALAAFKRARDAYLHGRAPSELGTRIRELAAEYEHAEVVDFEAELDRRSALEGSVGCNFFGGDSKWGCDQFHPNSRAHEILAEMLLGELPEGE